MPAREPLKTELMEHIKELRIVTDNSVTKAVDTGEVSLEEIGEEYMFHVCKHRR